MVKAHQTILVKKVVDHRDPDQLRPMKSGVAYFAEPKLSRRKVKKPKTLRGRP